MTEQQLVEEFRSYPKLKKSALIRQFLKVFEEDLEEIPAINEGLSIDERVAIARSLSGSLKMKNPPMTKEETREMYHEFLSEKHK